MIRLIIFCFCLLITALSATIQAQTYHNEWTQPDLPHARFAVTTSGVYRIPHSTIVATGLPPIGSGFQLYRNGQQVPLYTTTSGNFTAEDYLEFVGRGNDGVFDSLLFANATDQLTTARSLFTDTAMYYLTWNNTFPAQNSRFTTVPNDIGTAPPAETFFWHTVQNTVNNQFNPGMPFTYTGTTPVRFSGFDACEGFVGVNIGAGAIQNYNLNAAQIYTAAAEPAQLQVKLVGRSDEQAFPNDHLVQVSVNNVPYTEVAYDGFACTEVLVNLPLNVLESGAATLNVSSLGGATAIDVNAVAYYRLTYPHSYSFNGASFFAFTLPDNAEKYLEIANFNGGSLPVLYDLTNHLRLEAIQEGELLKYKLPQGSATGTRSICLTNTDAGGVNTANFAGVVQFTNFANTANQGNFIIITPATFTQSANIAEQYANYRRSIPGGSHSVQVVTIEQLYHQFAYGIAKHPLAIRNFINYAADTWATPPQYVLLLGKGITYNQATFNANAFNACLVPTYGVPASDALLAAPNPNQYVPQVAISRVPATNATEAANYLEKLITYENTQKDLFCDKIHFWRKDMLFLAQGDTGEVEVNVAFLENNKQTLESSSGYGGKVKGSFVNNKFGTISFPQITDLINQGMGLVHFAGNANNNGYWLTTINPPSSLDNEGKYPVMLANAARTGNMFDFTTGVSNTMIENYTLTPQRGSAAYMGNADAKFTTATNSFTQEVIQQFNTLNYGQSLALSMKNAAQTLIAALPDDQLMRFTLQTITLAGDPALSPLPRNRPEQVVPVDELSFSNPLTGFPIFSNPPLISSQMPGFNVKVVMKNLGQAVPDSIDLVVLRLTPTGEFLTLPTQRIPAPVYTDTLTVYLPNNLPQYSGFNTFTFTIDGSEELTEDCEFNNTAYVLADMRPYCIADLGPAVQYLLPDDFPFTLTPQGDEWLTYQWSTGETTPTITVNNFGTYSVTVTNAFGCISVDNITLTLNTGLPYLPDVLPVQVYPNPFTDVLHITGIQDCTLYLYNAAGVLIHHAAPQTDTYTLPAHQLPAGLYLLQAVHPQKGVVTQRIVK